MKKIIKDFNKCDMFTKVFCIGTVVFAILLDIVVIIHP